MTELRKQLREAGVDYKVYKNTMARRAAEAAGLEELTDTLVGPTAIAFSDEDVVAPARILNDFAKDHEALEIKGGVIEGNIASLDEITELASLPNYEGMVSMLLSVLQLQSATLRTLQKPWQNKKKNKVLNFYRFVV